MSLSLSPTGDTSFIPISHAQVDNLPATIDPMLRLPAQKLIQRYETIRRDLEADAPQEIENSQPYDSDHLADDASDVLQWKSRMAISHHLSTEMHQIEHAYALLQHGKYGICEHCGIAIPLGRLMIRPSATLCVTCQQRDDQMKTGH